MRAALMFMIVAGLAVPAAAQTVDTLDRRVTKVEKEVRALQREVFPGGDERFFEPDVRTPGTESDGFGVDAATPGAVMTERLNALEAQVQALTGQVEENAFRVRQMAERLERFESDATFRLEQLERGSLPAGGVDGEAAAGDGGPFDGALTQFRSGDFAGAQLAFAAFLEANPGDERASAAGYWLGRSLLAQDQPAQAVRTFLETYQTHRDGPRAPDSLLWVGRSLMQLDPPVPDRACQAYQRLEDEYDGQLSDEVAAGLAESRLAAECS
jgi:TolA-binding protein